MRPRLGMAWLPDHKQSLCGRPYWAGRGGLRFDKLQCFVQTFWFVRTSWNILHLFACPQDKSGSIVQLYKSSQDHCQPIKPYIFWKFMSPTDPLTTHPDMWQLFFTWVKFYLFKAWKMQSSLLKYEPHPSSPPRSCQIKVKSCNKVWYVQENNFTMKMKSGGSKKTAHFLVISKMW